MQLKHLLITVISFTSLSASAQINKGSVYLGGYLSFYSNKHDIQSSSSFAISPAVGLAVKENLVLGVDLNFGRTKNKREDVTSESTQQNLGGGVFVRKYATLGKDFYLFGQGRVGGSYIATEYEGDPSGDDGKGFSVDLGIFPGVAYSVSRKLQLEVGLPNVFNVGYSNIKYTPQSGSSYKNSSFGASTSVSSNTNFLSVGVRLFFQKNR